MGRKKLRLGLYLLIYGINTGKVTKIFQILHGQSKKMKKERKFNQKALKRQKIGKLRWGLGAKRQNQG